MTSKRDRAQSLAWKIEHALTILAELQRLTNEIDIEIRRLSLRLETVNESVR
jgi:hypothetical protein